MKNKEKNQEKNIDNYLISHLDQLIKMGKGKEARAVLEDYFLKKEVPQDAQLAEIASLCLRVGLFDKATKLLAPRIRPTIKINLSAPATPFEVLVYATALIQSGADLEGQKLLAELDTNKFPRVLFIEALAHFSHWDYEAAVPLLQSYVQHPQLSHYEKQVGKINLCAALVAITENIPVYLDDLINELRTEKKFLLLANALEIKAQSLIKTNDLDTAQNCLDEALYFLKEMGNRDVLFLKKWKSILKAKKEGPTSTIHREFIQIMEEAKKQKHWETVRDSDFYLAKFFDEERYRINKLYFGTPYESYRKNIQNEFSYSPPEFFDLSLDNNVNNELTFDFSDHPELKPGLLLFRLLKALCVDFYRPLSLAKLHEIVFPNRYFNPFSSPAVVYQAIKRLRLWLKKQNLPLQVIEFRGRYYLDGPVKIRLYDIYSKSKNPFDMDQRLFEWIKKIYLFLKQNKKNILTHTDAMVAGKSSSRTTHRFLKEATQSGFLIKNGKGKKTYYQPN